MSAPPVEAPPLSGRKHARSGAPVVARAKAKESAAAPPSSSSPPPGGNSGVNTSEKGGDDKDDASKHGEEGNVGDARDEEEEVVEEEEFDANGEEGDETNEADGANDGAPEGTHVPPTARRVRLTLGQKREVVDLAASKKFTHRELAQKFRVGRTTITNICRQEDLIRTETDSADATKKKRKTTRCSYDLRVLDECLHKWRMEVRVSSPDTKLTGTVLQQKAMDIACKIQRDPFAELPERVSQALAKFSASNGWLDGYRTRFGSFSSKHHGSHQSGGGGGDYSSAIKNVDVQTRLRELHHSLHSVELQDIWTGSEFAIMSQRPSASENSSANSNAASNGSAAEGGRSSGSARGRYTVSLFVSAAGEAFDLQVIGTDRCPLVLRGVDTQKNFRVHYGYSKTGWQVAHTTVSMLKALNARARARKRTFRVILDSAVPHVKAAMILDSQGDQRTFFVYDHLQIYFLPPNFKPPRFHPCHLGLVQAFKVRFRYELVETLFAQFRQNVQLNTHQPHGQHAQPSHLTNLTRLLHARNVFHWLHVALESLDKDLIQHCWLHSGLLPASALATLNTEVAAKLQASDAATANGASLFPTMIAAMNTTGLPNAHTLCRDLQALLSDIGQLAPEFLGWLGVPFAGGGGEASSVGSPNAVAYTELEGNAAVTDPGIDEVQLIRSVLQKHGMLSTTKLDDASHTDGQDESLEDVALEQPPRHEEVLVGVEILKKYLRLSGDAVPNRVQTIVELNRIKHAVRSAVLRDV